MDWSIYMSLALGIVTLFVNQLTPAALRHYGENYFEELLPPSLRLTAQSIHGVILFGLICALVWQQKAFALAPSLALIVSSLYGVWRCDHAYQIIPDRFHVFGFLGTIGFLLTGSAHYLWDWQQQLVPIAIGFMLPISLFAMNFLYEKLRDRNGLGMGDIKLCAWLAPLLGVGIYDMLFGACLLAVVIKLPKIFRDRNVQQTFAFGPYIVISALVTLFFQI